MAHIDWLSFTIKKECPTIADVFNLLPQVLPQQVNEELFPLNLDNFKSSVMRYEVRKGRFRYETCIHFENGIDVLCEPSQFCDSEIREKMGIHIVIPGSALSSLAYSLDEMAVSCWIDKVNRSGYDWKVARVDVAYDSLDITMAEIKEKIDNGEYCTKATIQLLTKIRSYNSSLETIYIGNRKSERYMRIYDKRIEQGLTTEECPNWVRFEMEFHNDSAVQALDCFCDGRIGGLFMGFFRILENLNDSNRCRNEVWKKMKNVIDFNEIVKISKVRETDTDRFFKNVVLPMYLAYKKDNPVMVKKLEDSGKPSVSVVTYLDRRRHEIQDYLNKGLSINEVEVGFDYTVYEQLSFLQA